jgi:hypothetical protein
VRGKKSSRLLEWGKRTKSQKKYKPQKKKKWQKKNKWPANDKDCDEEDIDLAWNRIASRLMPTLEITMALTNPEMNSQRLWVHPRPQFN